MKSCRLVLLCALLCSGPAMAGDLTLAAGYWDYKISGTVNRAGDVQDLRDNLGVEARDHGAYNFAWNTGPGWWKPDFAASYTPIKAGGEQVTSTGLRFGPIILLPGTTAHGDADLEDVDLTLRYPLHLGASALWAGVTVKHISGPVAVRGQNDNQEDLQQIDQVFPMLHLAANVPLTSWLSLGVQANGIKYQDDNAWEVRAGANIGVLGPLGLTLGWQAKHYRVAEGDYLLDATLSGALASVFIAFH